MFRLIVLGGANASTSADSRKELAMQRCTLGSCRMANGNNKEGIAIIERISLGTNNQIFLEWSQK